MKNLYEDVMTDPQVREYLPDPEQSSNKLPEREFFFIILGTVKQEYLKLVIEEAEKKRFKDGDQKKSADTIMITDAWLHELNKYPFISSKSIWIILIEKPGKAIYLIKERSRLVRVKKSHTKYEISLRLSKSGNKDEEMEEGQDNGTKRRKNMDGSTEII